MGQPEKKPSDSFVAKKSMSKAQLIFVLGAGGVGKTTHSILMALAAAKSGKKVGLLSIDPAKRLAAALNLPCGSQLKQLDLPVAGSLEAAMLDQKRIFDELVERFTYNKTTRRRILNNRLYQAASSKFGGALEYLAMAKVCTMVESGDYDLIIVDTPPDAHALDFLARPNILSGFMEQSVMNWLIKPFYMANKLGLSKLMGWGEKFAQGLAKITGLAALKVLAEFLVLMQDFIEGLHETGQKIVAILNSDQTMFVLVTTQDSAPVRSALNMVDQLNEYQYCLDTVILNRCFPTDVAQVFDDPEFDIDDDQKVPQPLRKLVNALQKKYILRQKNTKLLNDKLNQCAHVPSIKQVVEAPQDLHTKEALLEACQVYQEEFAQ